MNQIGLAASACVFALSVVLAGCAVAVPATGDRSGADASALGCALPSNCVSTAGRSGMPPLRYAGTSAQGLAALQAALASFPEAKVVRTEGLMIESIFTTPAGFRDEVIFIVDAASPRIDFRSRSLLGLFDFGKNRSRMREFSARFDKQVNR